jgi:hypothetical protein
MLHPSRLRWDRPILLRREDVGWLNETATTGQTPPSAWKRDATPACRSWMEIHDSRLEVFNMVTCDKTLLSTVDAE